MYTNPFKIPFKIHIFFENVMIFRIHSDIKKALVILVHLYVFVSDGY